LNELKGAPASRPWRSHIPPLGLHSNPRQAISPLAAAINGTLANATTNATSLLALSAAASVSTGAVQLLAGCAAAAAVLLLA